MYFQILAVTILSRGNKCCTENITPGSAQLVTCSIFPNCLFWRKLVYSCMSQPILTCSPGIEDNRWPCPLSSVSPTALVPGWLPCMLWAGPEASCFSLHVTWTSQGVMPVFSISGLWNYLPSGSPGHALYHPFPAHSCLRATDSGDYSVNTLCSHFQLSSRLPLQQLSCHRR